MKIEQIDNEIFVIDEFLTQSEEESINVQLKGAVWRYNWPNYEELPFVRPCWHVFIAGKGRPDRQSCVEELNSNDSWRFLIGFINCLALMCSPIGARLSRTTG
ncbi:hypothetical protein [Pseudomonas fluorescens]|uniref:hypothetical protein n=1 Tax=Pseudomonas fluorescens TaxID=294 RepID=UPI001784A705|nr:hypothetical protein [Pseudomonas fluorescens]